jgi:hypothetical protein
VLFKTFDSVSWSSPPLLVPIAFRRTVVLAEPVMPDPIYLFHPIVSKWGEPGRLFFIVAVFVRVTPKFPIGNT